MPCHRDKKVTYLNYYIYRFIIYNVSSKYRMKWTQKIGDAKIKKVYDKKLECIVELGPARESKSVFCLISREKKKTILLFFVGLR